eukprot:10155138-Karenia_brevis.AAC.1
MARRSEVDRRGSLPSSVARPSVRRTPAGELISFKKQSILSCFFWRWVIQDLINLRCAILLDHRQNSMGK